MTKKYDANINAYFTREQKAAIEEIAGLENVTKSVLMRRWVNKGIKDYYKKRGR